MAKRLWIAMCAMCALLVAAIAAAVAYGGPGDPPPMPSIGNPFRSVDYSTLPPLRHYQGEDGASLAYRLYAPEGTPKGSVVLVHGSAGQSNSMHVMGQGFARQGYAAYALDMRGHGDSGARGKIGYIGQLEDDVAAFMRTVAPVRPATLAGFSAGGGFALRFAGSKRQALFQSYLLMAPMLSGDAPNYRPGGGGWVSVGLPRIYGLVALNALGIQRFNDLTITRFALSERAKPSTTPEYSFALALNFRPQADYRQNIADARQPVAVIAGVDDELFVSEQLAPIFRASGQDWPVDLLDKVNHIGLTLTPAGVDAAVAAVDRLQAVR